MIKALQRSNQLLKMSVKVSAASYSSTNPQNLPRLPVPKLNETLNKFLESAEPHLTSSGFENTKNVVHEFGKSGGIGEKLQKLLEERAASKENWLSDPTSNWWLNCAYLQYRDPVVVWSSPGLVYPKRTFTSFNDQINYAAQMAHSALRYKTLIDMNQIPVEKMGKNELDMQQYKKVFGTCRIPGEPADSMQFHPESQHIIVVVNGIFFSVPILAHDFRLIGEDHLADQISRCVQEAAKQENPLQVGILTTDNRDNWAKSYQELINIKENRQAVEEIQQALFVLSIDRELPLIEDDITTAEYTLVTGAGSKHNSGNRWYDKTVQLVVGASGINGLTYEHSPAEGGPISVLSDYIIKETKERDAGLTLPMNGGTSYSFPTMLTFKSTPQLEEYIKIASDNIDKLSGDIDMGHLVFTQYGKNFIKTQKFSPDSYIQIAIQFAFYRLYQEAGAQYESAGTRLYVHGRTDVIRSCSKEAIAFSKAMMESKNDMEKVKKLRAAIESHKNYVNAAVQGFGIDRHLLGLKLIAKENGIDVPALYSDEGYVKSSNYRLSTSQVASSYEAFMCYGPLTNDGYGVCYSPRNTDIYFGLSSMRSNKVTSTAKFRKSLEEALKLMMQLLLKAGEMPVKSKL